MLYQVVARELQTFLARVEHREGPGLPGFVRRELAALLDCGILSKGFARVRCKRCGDDLLVAFSCKGRGICPSCGGRRMADTAAHLVDRVLPRVPVRQWVLSLPFSLRFVVAFDRELCRQVREVFMDSVLQAMRRRAKRQGIPMGQSGAVVFLQRFGGALNLNVHFHCGGRREVLALITEGSVVRGILECLGLPVDAPMIHPARGPPELF